MQQNEHLLSWLYVITFESRHLTDEDASPHKTAPLPLSTTALHEPAAFFSMKRSSPYTSY